MSSSYQEGASSCAPRVYLQALAEAKKLPLSFLRQLGLVDLDNNAGIGIPYFDLAGDKIAVKRRTTLVAKEGSYWQRNTPLAAYGQWRFHEASKVGWLILVEGESDCWTLWHHGYPALGIPGAGAAKTLTRDLLVGITKLYIHIEDDQGGRMFQDGMLRQLGELQYTDQCFTFHMPKGIKDPSDLHIQDEPNFKAHLERAFTCAEPQTPAHLHPVIRGPGPVASGGRKPTDSGDVSDNSFGHVKESVGLRPPLARKRHFVERMQEINDEATESTTSPMTTVLRDVNEDKVHWLWPGRIPQGKLTVLDGDPGLGKSTVTLDLAARLSRGLPMPGASEATLPPSHVLLLTAEDGLGDTIRPRLTAANADLDHVIAFEGLNNGKGDISPVWLPNHIHHLREIVKSYQAKLVIVDPLMAYLPESVNSNNDQSVRQALLPLADLAQEMGVAIVVVRHLNKQPGRNALYRGGGSIGIVGAARSALLVVKDNDNPNRRYIGVTKSNLCKQPKTLAFELVEGAGSAFVSWLDETDRDINSLLTPSEDAEPDALNEATAFLRERLADGPVLSTEISAEAKELGISGSTLKRAKKVANVTSRKLTASENEKTPFVCEIITEA